MLLTAFDDKWLISIFLLFFLAIIRWPKMKQSTAGLNSFTLWRFHYAQRMEIIINFNADLDLRLTFDFKFLLRCSTLPIIFNNLEDFQQASQSSITIRKAKRLGPSKLGKGVRPGLQIKIVIYRLCFELILSKWGELNIEKISPLSDHKFSL